MTIAPKLQDETKNYINRVAQAGGNVDAQTIYKIDRFISKGKIEGWWSAMKLMWIPVGDFTASKVFLVLPTGVTPVFYNFVEADYNMKEGYMLLTNSNKYIDTNFIPDNHGLTNENITIAYAAVTESLGVSSSYMMGAIGVASGVNPSPRVSAISGVIGLSNKTFNMPSRGFIGISASCRYGPSTMGSAINGIRTQLGDNDATAITMPYATTLFRTDRENLATHYAIGSISHISLGDEITDEQNRAYSGAIFELMQDVRKGILTQPAMGCLGDSITAGSSANGKTRFSRVLANKLGLREENHGQGSSLLRVDQALSDTVGGVNRYSAYQNRDIGTVCVIYGTNDVNADPEDTVGTPATIADYQLQMSNVLAGLKSFNKKVICGTPPWRQNVHLPAKQENYAAACAAACKANKIACADLYRAVLDNGMNNDTYFPDGLHPDPAAHELMAEYLYQSSMGRLIRRPTLDFASIAAGAQEDLTVTVLNAEVGMTVYLGLPSALETGLIVTAFVSANDTVTVRAYNTTGSAIDPASAVYKVTVQTNY